MREINILYVDDNTDPYISQYLLDNYKKENVSIAYKELKFEVTDTYESMLNNVLIRSADVVIIDSVLFENSKLANEKLSGEEFGIILKKIFPYKEFIVVTQNEPNSEFKIIKKYDTSSKTSKEEFFEKQWKPSLDRAIENILTVHKIVTRIQEKNYIEKYLFEEIQQSLLGETSYQNLTVEDIDKLVEAFENVRKVYEDK